MNPVARSPEPMDGVNTGLFTWILTVGWVFCFLGCQPNKGADPSASKASMEVKKVQASSVQKVHFERTVKVVGTLAAMEESVLRSRLAGRVQSIQVDIGSKVNKGDLIAELEPREMELEVRQAEALLAQARAALGLPLAGGEEVVDFQQTSPVRQAQVMLNEAARNRNRAKQLNEQGISSQSEMEAALAAYEVAENRYQAALEDARQKQALLRQRAVEVEMARQRLTDTRILAPFDGVIQERMANPGDYLKLSDPVGTIVRVNPLRLQMRVPERESAWMRVGQTIRLTVEGDAQVYSGHLARLSPAIDERTRMLTVEADVPNPGTLRPGAFARAEIVVNPGEPALAVPRRAVVTFAGIEKVYVVQGGKAQERHVETGRASGELVELISGAQADEMVVIDPANLFTGQALEVLNTFLSTATALKGETSHNLGP